MSIRIIFIISFIFLFLGNSYSKEHVKEIMDGIHMRVPENELMALLEKSRKDIKKEEWNDIMFDATAYYSEGVLQFCLDNGADVQYRKKSPKGVVPINMLYHAILHNNTLETIKYLAGKGLPMNERDSSDHNALHYAASRSTDGDVIRFIIDQGINVHSTDEYKCSPLHHALASPNNRFTCETCYFYPLDQPSPRIIGRTNSMNEKRPDPYGNEIQNFINYPSLEVIEALVLKGANVNQKTGSMNSYKTPFMYFHNSTHGGGFDYNQKAYSKDRKIVDFLLKNGLEMTDEKIKKGYESFLFRFNKIQSSDGSNQKMIFFLREKGILPSAEK